MPMKTFRRPRLCSAVAAMALQSRSRRWRGARRSSPEQVVDDQVDQLDADERRDDPTETVDQEVAPQQRARADRPVAHATQRQRDQRGDDERVEDDRRDYRAPG